MKSSHVGHCRSLWASTAASKPVFCARSVGIRIFALRRNSRHVITPSSLLMRGRLLETVLKAEQGAVPAAVARNHALGRPRDSARRAIRPACEELAVSDRRVAGLVCAARVDKSASGAPKGGRVDRKTRAVPAGTVSNIAPPGAPLPLVAWNGGGLANLGRDCAARTICHVWRTKMTQLTRSTQTTARTQGHRESQHESD